MPTWLLFLLHIEQTGSMLQCLLLTCTVSDLLQLCNLFHAARTHQNILWHLMLAISLVYKYPKEKKRPLFGHAPSVLFFQKETLLDHRLKEKQLAHLKVYSCNIISTDDIRFHSLVLSGSGS